MEIVIWGTKVCGRKAEIICINTGRKIKAFTDNDPLLWGKEIDGIPIISPKELTEEYVKDIQIWIATGAIEVYEQAKKISENIIEWPLLKLMLLGNKYPYSSKELKNENICNCRLLENRIELLKQFADKAKDWKMAEVGVFKGDFSDKILKICNPKKLFLIDLWGKNYESYYLSVKERFNFETKIEILRGFSTERLSEFDDGELDWVYIDTVHDYETTKAELELCHMKISTKGYICGHDYVKHNVYSKIDYGVYDAVNEFAVTNDYEFIYLTTEGSGLQSFCITKRI